MRRAIALSVVLAALTALPATASAAPFLGKGEAKAAATMAVQRTFGSLWQTGYEKKIKPFYRIGRSRWQVSYDFRTSEDEFCYGDVIVWRSRYGGLFTNVRPYPELSDSICRF